jgi:hypothetical protein
VTTAVYSSGSSTALTSAATGAPPERSTGLAFETLNSGRIALTGTPTMSSAE